MWVLIDNVEPNKPCIINTDNLTDITWNKGTLAFECVDNSVIEVEAEKEVFIKIATELKPEVEIE